MRENEFDEMKNLDRDTRERERERERNGLRQERNSWSELIESNGKTNLCREIGDVVGHVRSLALEIVSHEILTYEQ